MKRQRLTWLIFSVCVLVLLGALGWLSVRLLELEQAYRLAGLIDQHEEEVRLALWRLDSRLATLVAGENARPYFAYTSFYSADRPFEALLGRPASPELEPVPSPLLTQLTPEVRIHFQIAPGHIFSSPQVPLTANLRRYVEENYAIASRMNTATQALNDLRSRFSADTFLALLSATEAQPDNSALTALLPADPVVAPETQEGELFQRQDAGSVAFESPQQILKLNNTLQTQKGKAEFLNRSSNVRQQMEQQKNFNISNDLSQSARQSKANPQTPAVVIDVQPLQPVWADGELFLLRRVRVANNDFLQGCWLDWPTLCNELLKEAALPGATLVPVRSAEPPDAEERRLAALPLRLESPVPADPGPAGWTPLRGTLVLAWAGALLAALAVGALLRGALELGERRAMFVSSVTHELRTPLTTFGMYADMLLAGMVPAEKREKYLRTLCTETRRLEHLVENVLAYARLEKRDLRKRLKVVMADELFSRDAERLRGRAEQAGMTLTLELQKVAPVYADPSAVEQIIFNLVDNACKYAASATDRRLHLTTVELGDGVTLTVRDHGPGVPVAGRAKLFRPFAKSDVQAAESAPGVGLGLHLSRRLARAMGGELELLPESVGAAFRLTLRRAPLAEE